MNKIKLFYRQGFTLMELLIVLAIVLALFAIVLPTLFTSRTKSLVNQAKLQIGQLESNLELFATENRGYPTTEQGLYALIYFPDNQVVAMTSPLSTQPSAMMPGMDPNAAFAGNAVSVGGQDVFGSPTGGAPIGSPTPPVGPAYSAGMTNPTMDNMGMPNTMPGVMGNPMGNPMGGANPIDPMTGMTGTNPMATAWTQPFHNPQIYTQLRKRTNPYLDSDKSLIDPWGQQYRYDNSMQYNGLNRTGEAKPAIWSAGPDKRDGTEDDVLGWDPNEAQRRIAQQQQQQLQFQGGMGQGGMGVTNPMDMMGNPMGMVNPMDPTGTGMTNPPMTPTTPTGIPNQPGMMNPLGGGAMNPMNGTSSLTQPTIPNSMSPPISNPTPMPNPMPTPLPTPTPTQPM
ncbi:MAG: type II secretion system protein GspG [Planctomycetaceae bacterium]|nr:type II secretion system protein GspG [Planctomycetaceae bacterium]